MPSELLTERHGAVLVLTLREPGALNRLSQQLVAAFAEALDVAESDPGVACVVVRGEGANFCTGADFGPSGARAGAAAGGAEDDGTPGLVDAVNQLIEALQVFPKPVLAAVEGIAAGSGFSLALACDLVIAARDAQFALSVGPPGGHDAPLPPAEAGAVWQLSRALPAPLLQQLVWLGEPVDATRLHGCGLVGWLCDGGRALAQALRVAERLAAAPPDSLAAGKELVQQARRRGLADHREAARDLLRALEPAGGDADPG